MIKILIADDHAIVREGLKQIIAEDPDIVIEGEAGTGPEVLEKFRSNNYDIIILDISLPLMSGLDVLKEIKAIKHDQNVLMLSMHPEEQYALRTLKAGASGYLTKDSAPAELIKAVRRVSTGRKYIGASLAEKFADYIDIDHSKALHQSLSDREYQVLQMIASGKSMKEIAQMLFISVKTVSTYRSRVLDKMNMHSNAELTRYAIEQEIVE